MCDQSRKQNFEKCMQNKHVKTFGGFYYAVDGN